jgi:hypothetical protein
MDRSCLLCVGRQSVLKDLIRKRIDSGENDYMKYAFAIPVKDTVSVSALRLTPEMRNIMLPIDEFLHPGYCGEECRDLLLSHSEFRNDNDLYVIVGIESPGCGYTTYDLVFPQGRTDRGENSRDASMREFSEETGIDIKATRHPLFLGFVGKKKEMSVYAYRVT